VVERLGNLEEIASKHPGTDPWQWARTRAEELTRKEREDTREVLVAYRPNRQIAKGEGWIPAHTRTDLTDDLHQAFGYRTDYQLVSNRQMNKIVRSTKK
jgi:FixJ family two-component response regulator